MYTDDTLTESGDSQDQSETASENHGGYIHAIEISDDPTHKTVLTLRDRDIALRDLKEDSVFQPCGDRDGPYDVKLSIEENRLIFRMQNVKGADLSMLVLSLKPYKRLIQDYFMIVRSYEEALAGANPSRIEAIDMGRRGIHNEGAEMMLERLKGKINMDMDTARRLFTLICILHEGKALLFR